MKEIRTIGIDTDDVLLDLNGALHPFHNRHHGTSVTFKEVNKFNLWEVWGCTKEEAIERVYSFYKSEDFQTLSPIDDSVKAINQLRKKYDLVVISSRPAFLMNSTKQSLEKDFPGCFDRICLTDSYGHADIKKTKAQICLEEGVDVLIDDYIGNFNGCAKHGIKPLLFRRPWNLSISDSELKNQGIIPAENWYKILEILD